jgi:DNA modification methylase
VLDLFLGSGTTSLVALKHNRKSIGIDISEEYIELSNERIDEYKYKNSGVLHLGPISALGLQVKARRE